MSEVQVSNPQDVKKIKDIILGLQRDTKSVQITKTDGAFLIRTSVEPHSLSPHLEPYLELISIRSWTNENHESTPNLVNVTEKYLKANCTLSPSEVSHLCSCLPKKWSIYNPMVLFGSGTYDSEIWQKLLLAEDMLDYFETIKCLFQGEVTHFAVNKPIIEEDIMRRPFNLFPIYGDFGARPTNQTYDSPTGKDLEAGFWCHTIQNKIYQTWAPCYTMFSRGNIREKKRLLEQYRDLNGKFVVDLYAGIGYFTLSYLANGATLFCWEINRWSIEGLVRGLKKNKHSYKLIERGESILAEEIGENMKLGVKAFVFFESNEFATERLKNLQNFPLQHINLGLLPTLKPSWPIAKELAAKSSLEPTVHVHENIHCDDFENLEKEVSDYFSGPTSLEKVKTFAPDVWHVVVDVNAGKEKAPMENEQ